MGYRQRQTQADCNRCGEPTLHTQVLYEVPNGVYLIVLIVLGVIGTWLFWPVLALAALWFGVWFIHILANALHNMINADAAYRCGHCGQRMGQRTPEQIAAQRQHEQEWRQQREHSRAERLEHERQRRLDRAVVQRAEKLQQVRERNARQPHLEEIRQAQARRQGHFYAAVWGVCCRFPGTIDDGLKTLAGEGNEVIYGFLQIVTLGCALSILGILMWLAYRCW